MGGPSLSPARSSRHRHTFRAENTGKRSGLGKKNKNPVMSSLNSHSRSGSDSTPDWINKEIVFLKEN